MLPDCILDLIHKKVTRSNMDDVFREMQLRYAAVGHLFDIDRGNACDYDEPVKYMVAAHWERYDEDFEEFHTVYHPDMPEHVALREYIQKVSLGFWYPTWDERRET